ncbi:MAG: PQQ-binding-like beta-propeller repeat protein [Thermoanaerobaculia bacterium]
MRRAATGLLLALWAGGATGAEQAAMLGGGPARNNASPERSLPSSLDPASGRNVLWTAELGTEAYAGPVVAGGKVFVGTNNGRPRDPKVQGDRGVVMAFAAGDGALLWQSVHEKLEVGRNQDWPQQGVCSTPAVSGPALYYLSNRGELVALASDPPRSGSGGGPSRSDRLWGLDLRGQLGVVAHFMTASSPLLVGERIFAVTGNSIDDHGKVAAPKAPSFIAVDRAQGKLLWADASPGEAIFEGQWGSPVYLDLAAGAQVVFPGGDGKLYSFDPATGKRLWIFDANRPVPGGPAAERGALVATPVFAEGRLFAALGRNPDLGSADGRLWALDPSKLSGGEPTVLWSRGGRDFSFSLSSPVVAGGVVYAADLAGFLHALDAATGQELWKYDAFAAVWGSPLVADGKVYLGDEDGDLAILKAGRSLEKLAEVNLGDAIYTTPTAAQGVLYVTTARKLYALREGAGPKAAAAKP